MYRSIMVPLDGSTFGEQALPVAAALARRTGARLLLVHVLDVLIPPQYSQSVDAIEWWEGGADEAAWEYVRGVAEKLSRGSGVQCAPVVTRGAAVPALLEQAETTDAGMIVMTTHGRGKAKRLWLGSVADAIVRQSRVPVLLVRATTPENARGEEPFEHVLVPLDGSELAEQVLPHALEVAGSNNARITLLRVVHPWVAVVPAYAHAGIEAPPAYTLTLNEEQANEYLAVARNLVRGQHARVETATVTASGADAGEILEYAEANDVDLIALATHGRGGAKRLLLGSVADKIVRGATMPVLVFRPEE
jgi:nucleotide-binding universal stress UspA family protein